MTTGRGNGLAHGLRLAWALGARDLRTRYASSFGGGAWLIALPLVYSTINIFVFSILMSGRMGAPYNDVPFALFYFSAFSIWTLFAEVSGRSTSLLREYSYLINKIAFPVWVVPLIAFASALMTQMVVIAITAVLMLWYAQAFPAHAWTYLLVWACGVVITLGFAYAISSLSMFVPDFTQFVPVCITILFFLTPILYSPAIVMQGANGLSRGILMDWNPFFYLIEAARAAILDHGAFPWHYLGYAWAFAVVVLAIGTSLFRRLEKGFADVI